jgi:tagaturonate reductase
LWAIEGPPELEDILSFTKGDNGVFVKPDIEVFKSLKLHLLNGTHTLSASLAWLSGFETVKQAMEDQDFSAFIKNLMLNEIGKAIPYPVSPEQINEFGSKVLDRFRNPFLKHNWINITFQNTAKMRMRNIPVLKEYHKLYSSAPKNMTVGFAAFIVFMRAVKKEGGNYYGNFKGREYKINDDQAAFFYEVWQQKPVEQVVETILGNRDLWGEDLSALTGFKTGVQEALAKMMNEEVAPKEI